MVSHLSLTARFPTLPQRFANPLTSSGKISSIDITTEHETKNATVTFELPTAASTALLLNHTTLGGNEITITGSDAASAPSDTSTSRGDSPHLTQEEKPRARILAEILAHGYVVADAGLQKAISLDDQHNISSRFVATLKQLDAKTGATDRALAADASYGLSARASSLLTGLGSYFERQRETPAGRKIVAFYTTGQKQVQDIHTEARRLAELKKEQEGGGKVYKGLGLDKVLGSVQPASSSAGAAGAATEGKSNDQVPGGAPAAAVATESATKPTAESKIGNPKVIH